MLKYCRLRHFFGRTTTFRTNFSDSFKMYLVLRRRNSTSALYDEMVAKGMIRFDRNQKNLVDYFDSIRHKIEAFITAEPDSIRVEPTVMGFMKGFPSFFSGMSGDKTPNEESLGKLKGVYIYGSPGTGKTFLMDVLYKALNTGLKSRVHFNEFMLGVHKRLHTLREQNTDQEIDLLKQVAKDLRKDSRVVCFDEFQVTDITDAVILKRLFTLLIKDGVFVIITSNRHPNELYKNGLQREQIFLPFIKFLRENTQVINLDSGVDYRSTGTRLKSTYFYPNNEENRLKFKAALEKVTEGGTMAKTTLDIDGRLIDIPLSYKKICVFDFESLSKEAMGAADFRTLARRFRTVFLRSVRRIGVDEGDILRRFITLVDQLYQEKVRLVILAEVSLKDIFRVERDGSEKRVGSVEIEGRDEIFAWERCRSRLEEMQSKEYLDQAFRITNSWK